MRATRGPLRRLPGQMHDTVRRQRATRGPTRAVPLQSGPTRAVPLQSVNANDGPVIVATHAFLVALAALIAAVIFGIAACAGAALGAVSAMKQRV